MSILENIPLYLTYHRINNIEDYDSNKGVLKLYITLIISLLTIFITYRIDKAISLKEKAQRFSFKILCLTLIYIASNSLMQNFIYTKILNLFIILLFILSLFSFFIQELIDNKTKNKNIKNMIDMIIILLTCFFIYQIRSKL